MGANFNRDLKRSKQSEAAVIKALQQRFEQEGVEHLVRPQSEGLFPTDVEVVLKDYNFDVEVKQALNAHKYPGCTFFCEVLKSDGKTSSGLKLCQEYSTTSGIDVFVAYVNQGMAHFCALPELIAHICNKDYKLVAQQADTGDACLGAKVPLEAYKSLSSYYCLPL